MIINPYMLCSDMENSISKKISSTLSYHTRDMVSGIDIRDTQSKEVSVHADFPGWLETY